MKLSFVITLLCATQAMGKPPVIITDVAPIHGLVSAVTEGVTTPELLLPHGASPHDYTMRPSDAAALQTADVVFYVGDTLSPQLHKPLESLANNAIKVELLDTVGWPKLAKRDLEDFGHDAHHDHDHGDRTDPHAFLGPNVMAAWAQTVADTLAQADSENAATYTRNAERFAEQMNEIIRNGRFKSQGQFIVSHDAFQYFEAAMRLQAAGTIALSDAQSPGAAHLIELQKQIAADNITCIFTDPQTNPDRAKLLGDGSNIKIRAIDPLGSDIPLGPTFNMLHFRSLAQTFQECITP